MAGFTSTDIDTAQAAYVTNVDYDTTASVSKAKLFIAAVRKLLLFMNDEDAEQSLRMRFDKVTLRSELEYAIAWWQANDTTAAGTSIVHPDLTENWRGA
jgi:hypothetical protein